ncbi:MAG: diguanylate cyclase, partial [Pseudomonadota bacterium]|nr:diguanylate cyclase [Pseudomonadota bacterium]
MRPLQSLRVRIKLLLTAMVALSIGICVVVFGWVGFYVFQQQANHLLDQAESAYYLAKQEQDERLLQRTQMLAHQIALQQVAGGFDAEIMQQLFRAAVFERPAELLSYYDPQHQIAVGDPTLKTDLQAMWSAVWAQAQLEGMATATDVLNQQLYQIAIVPVRWPQAQQSQLGWLTVITRVDHHMAYQLRDRLAVDVSFVQMQPTPKVVLASSLDKPAQVDLMQLDASQRSVQLAETAYQSRWLLTHPAANTYAVILQYPSSRVFAPFYELFKVILLFALLSFLLIGLTSVMIARMVTRPLQQLMRTAQHIQQGDYQQVITPPKTRELAELANSLSHMQNAIQQREQRVLAIAEQDLLTGVYNRTGFLRQIEPLLATQQPMSAILINIDRFQQINDTLGHPFGDQVLAAFAKQLQAILPEQHVLGRFGGDEFSILIDSSNTDWYQLIDQMQQLFAQPLQVAERTIDVRATIGVAHYPEHAKNAVDLMCCADEAVYIGKEDRVGLKIYNPERQRFRAEHLSLLGELKAALSSNQLMLYFQPKIALQPQHKEGLAQVEALIRWQHPTRGFVPPSEFIPFAEQTSDIRELTRWVIQRGCQDAARFQALGHPVCISVNISVRDLLD